MLLKEKIINKKTVRLILSWEHSGFNVDASIKVNGSDKKDVERVARYMAKGPVSLKNLSYDQHSSKITYKTKRETMTMEPVEFIGHFLAHTPEPYENSCRYFGAYSNRVRNRMWRKGAWKHPDDKSREDPCVIEIQETTPVKKSSSSWARLIRKIWLQDPEVCPDCGSRWFMPESSSQNQNHDDSGFFPDTIWPDETYH